MDSNARIFDPVERRSLASYLCLGLLPVAGFVAAWELLNPGYRIFVVVGTYAALCTLAVLQMVRAALMDTWTRRIAAIGVVVGLAVTIFMGLRPKLPCIEAAPCLSGISLHPSHFLLGVALTVESLYLDPQDRQG